MSDHENYYSSDDNSSIFEENEIPDINSLIIPKKLNENLYPLKNTWVMYDHTKSDSETYEASTRKICEFNNVINFWQIFNNYPNPSKLFNNGIYRPIMKCADGNKEISSISVFKKGILPKWEDPVNKYGAEFSKRKFNKKDSLKELDSNWLDILMACIGCVIDQSVTGIRVVDSSAPKKNEHTGTTEFKVLYRIELWFDNIAKKQIIEDQFKNILSIEDPRAIYYKEHNIPSKNE
jgi:hypothetical protein